jgi:hypothetical protein
VICVGALRHVPLIKKKAGMKPTFLWQEKIFKRRSKHNRTSDSATTEVLISRHTPELAGKADMGR